MEKVYKFNMKQPFKFFKAGHYIANSKWRHKDVINDGDYELFIMLSGDAFIQIDHHNYSLHRHDCLLIPPFRRHVGFKDSPKGTTYYWLHFFPRKPVNQISIPNTIHDGEIVIPSLCHLRRFTRITLLMRQLLDSANSPQALAISSDYFLSSLAAEINNQYIEYYQAENAIKDTSRYEVIKNWIRIHSYENLNVAQVAAHFEISPTYLTHLFHIHDQTTTISFINQVRIQQAQELLLTTDMSVKQIALTLHFDNEKYFYRVFKKVTGTTANRYRNAYNKTYLNNTHVDPQIPQPVRGDTHI